MRSDYKKSSSEVNMRVAVVFYNGLFRSCLVEGVKKDSKYDCIGVDPSERGAEDFPIEDVGLHVVGYDSRNKSQASHIEDIVQQIADSKALSLVVIQSGLNEDLKMSIERCVSVGAYGCVSDNEGLEGLYDAMGKVISGEQHLSQCLVGSIFEGMKSSGYGLSGQGGVKGVRLTGREREVLGLVRENLSNKEIAKELHISLYTVKNHVHNIIEKLDVETRHQAVDYAVENRLMR